MSKSEAEDMKNTQKRLRLFLTGALGALIFMFTFGFYGESMMEPDD